MAFITPPEPISDPPDVERVKADWAKAKEIYNLYRPVMDQDGYVVSPGMTAAKIARLYPYETTDPKTGEKVTRYPSYQTIYQQINRVKRQIERERQQREES